MADLRKMEFFLLRYVPDAVKEEFVNVGMVMIEPEVSGGFADVRFRRDFQRARCPDPHMDIEMLKALERDIREQLGDPTNRELILRRFNDSFSNLIQLSATKACLVQDPAKELAALAKIYFGGPKRQERQQMSERKRLLKSMRRALVESGVWRSLIHGVPTAPYTGIGDPFKFDLGYRIGKEIKLFHAVSVKANVEQAIILAARYPKIATSMARGCRLRSVAYRCSRRRP